MALEASEPTQVFQRVGMRGALGQSRGSAQGPLPPSPHLLQRQAGLLVGGCRVAEMSAQGAKQGHAVCHGKRAEQMPAEDCWGLLRPPFLWAHLPVTISVRASHSPAWARPHCPRFWQGGWDFLRVRLPSCPAPCCPPVLLSAPALCRPMGHHPWGQGCHGPGSPPWEVLPGSCPGPGRHSFPFSCLWTVNV